MAEAPPCSGAPQRLRKPEEEGAKGPAKPPPSPSRKKRSSSSSSAPAAAAAASASPDAVVPSSSSAAAKGGAAKTSSLGTLAIPIPVTPNSGFPSSGGHSGGECRSFSQLLAGAMASPVGNSHATPILAVPVDAVRVPVVAVPCIIAPAALLESPGFTGQFAMTHQAVLATVTAQAQMQLQSGYTPLSSPAPIQQRPPLTSEDKILSSKVEQPPSPDQKLQTAQIVLKTTSGDGFNWRKYGQKQVKSGENSRSYYKCTQANCLAKKKVERYPDGVVVEVIYRGEHNHDPPQKTKCSKERGPHSSVPSGENETLTIASGDTTGSEPSPSKVSQECAHNNDADQMTKCSKERRPQSSGPREENETLTCASVDPIVSDPSSKVDQNTGSGTSENQLPCSNDREGVVDVRVEGGHGEGPDPKRRLTEISLRSPSSLVRTVKEAKVVIQAASDVGLVSDGYRWRKYGQKFVKGNPNPRSYYRCTQIGCPVRKHVERDSADAKAIIITYEGKHNHDSLPQKNDNDAPALLMSAAAAAAATAHGDRQTQAPKSLADKEPKHEPQDTDSKMTGENASELVGDKTLESAQTLLSMGLKSTPEEDGERKNSDAIQRPLFNENRAAVPVQNS